MADESEVGIAVRWAEAGAQIPAEATGKLERLGAAMGRLENREPTMVLRAMRGEIAMLSAEASGVGGPLGRLGAHMAMFGVGGAAGLVAIGGLAAVGMEVKKLLDIVPTLDTEFKKLNDEFGKMGGPGAQHLMAIAALQDRIEQLSEPTMWDRIRSGLRALGGGTVGQGALGQFEDVRSIERATEGATFHNELMRQHAEAMKYHADAIKKHGEELTKARQARDDRRRQDELASPTVGVLGDTYAQARLGLGGNLPALTDFSGGTTPVSQTMNAPGRAQENIWDPGAPSGAGPDRAGERLGKVLARELTGPVIALAAGIGRGSGGGAAVAGLGGIAGTLASLPSLAGSATPLGIISGALSGLSTLFGGGTKPRVVIDSYEAQAIEQLKTLREDSLTTQIIFVDSNDPRQTQYDLGRLTRRDSITRGP